MMAQRSDVDRRARRTVPRQCVSDWGMHKDASDVRFTFSVDMKARVINVEAKIVYRARPLKDEIAALQKRPLEA